MKALLAFVVCLFSANASAWNVGGAITGANSYFEAQREQEDRDRRNKMHDLEMRRQQQQIEMQRLQIEAMKQKQSDDARQAKQEADRASETVQAAIDRNETLRLWQTWNGRHWERAKEVDKMMRALPENAGLTLDERFANVVRFVETEAAMRK